MRTIFNIIIVSLFIGLPSLIGSCSRPNEVSGGAGSETTNTLTGKVLDQDNEVLPNARVLVRPKNLVAGKDSSEAYQFVETKTDSFGQFEADLKDPGEYVVEVNSGDTLMKLFEIFIDTEGVITNLPIVKLAAPGGIAISLPDFLENIPGSFQIPEANFLMHTGDLSTFESLWFLPGLPEGRYTSLGFIPDDTPNDTVLLALDVVVVSGDTLTIEKYSQWSNGYTVSLNLSNLSGSLTDNVHNFPLVIRLDESFDFDKVNNDGSDIRLLDKNNKNLNFDLALWEPQNKKATLWVRLDTVYVNDQNQTLKLYSGFANATHLANETEVFDTGEGFVGVWHLNETGSTNYNAYKDATNNKAHGTGVKMSAQSSVDGVVGKAQLFDGSSNYIEISKEPLFDYLNVQTISAWFKINLYDIDYQCLIAKGDSTWRMHRHQRRDNIRFANSKNENIVKRGTNSETNINDSTWHHVAGVYDGENVMLYLDGVLDTLTDSAYYPVTESDDPVWIGNNSTPDKSYRFWNGLIDEARVSRVVRSSDWIRLSYENQKIGSTLITINRIK